MVLAARRRARERSEEPSALDGHGRVEIAEALRGERKKKKKRDFEVAGLAEKSKKGRLSSRVEESDREKMMTKQGTLKEATNTRVRPLSFHFFVLVRRLPDGGRGWPLIKAQRSALLLLLSRNNQSASRPVCRLLLGKERGEGRCAKKSNV